MKIGVILTAALGALALGGCGNSSDQPNSSDEKVPAPIESDVSEEADNDPKQEQSANALTAEDKDAIIRHGACGFANKLVIGAARLSGVVDSDPIILISKHRGAVHYTLAARIINKYPDEMTDALTEHELSFQNQYLPRITGEDLEDRTRAYREVVNYNSENCDFTSAQGHAAMNDHKEIYDRFSDMVMNKGQ